MPSYNPFLCMNKNFKIHREENPPQLWPTDLSLPQDYNCLIISGHSTDQHAALSGCLVCVQLNWTQTDPSGTDLWGQMLLPPCPFSSQSTLKGASLCFPIPVTTPLGRLIQGEWKKHGVFVLSPILFFLHHTAPLPVMGVYGHGLPLLCSWGFCSLCWAALFWTSLILFSH